MDSLQYIPKSRRHQTSYDEGTSAQWFAVLSQLSYNLSQRGVTMVGTFIAGYGAEMLRRTLQHISMVGLALVLAASIGVSLGVAISEHERVARWVVGAASVLFTVPSLALFALLVVALAPIRQGTGRVPAVTALTLYSVLPIVRNTWVALRQVDPSTVQAAQGMGMTPGQVMLHVKLPLALPLIMAGVRNAAVMGVGMATIATLIGGVDWATLSSKVSPGPTGPW